MRVRWMNERGTCPESRIHDQTVLERGRPAPLRELVDMLGRGVLRPEAGGAHSTVSSNTISARPSWAPSTAERARSSARSSPRAGSACPATDQVSDRERPLPWCEVRGTSAAAGPAVELGRIEVRHLAQVIHRRAPHTRSMTACVSATLSHRAVVHLDHDVVDADGLSRHDRLGSSIVQNQNSDGGLRPGQSAGIVLSVTRAFADDLEAVQQHCHPADTAFAQGNFDTGKPSRHADQIHRRKRSARAARRGWPRDRQTSPLGQNRREPDDPTWSEMTVSVSWQAVSTGPVVREDTGQSRRWVARERQERKPLSAFRRTSAAAPRDRPGT